MHFDPWSESKEFANVDEVPNEHSGEAETSLQRKYENKLSMQQIVDVLGPAFFEETMKQTSSTLMPSIATSADGVRKQVKETFLTKESKEAQRFLAAIRTSKNNDFQC